MINLKNDYCGIAHPKVLEKLIQNQTNKFNGYGLDDASSYSTELIRKTIKCETADVHYLVGGTITNKIVIAHALRPSEAVICVDTGHINVHETGAIEETSHKVLTVPNINGKLVASKILDVLKSHTDEHMVKPKMVYVSNSTESGSVYTYQELKEIHDVCKENGLYFYLDGARLGAALTSKKSDLKIEDLPKLVDVFYIGGTKNGLPLGEAVVIINEELKKNFRFSIKHFGGMYSKGFVLGLCFSSLFEDNLFFEIAKKENELAEKLYNDLTNIGIKMASCFETNQIFPILKNEIIEKLKEHIMFEVWEQKEFETTIRFVTSYMTTESEIKEVVNLIKSLK